MKDGIKCMLCGLILASAFIIGLKTNDWLNESVPKAIAAMYMNNNKDTYNVPVYYRSEPVSFLMSSPYEALPRSMHIEITEPVGNTYLNDSILLKAVVNGFEGTDYKIKWQYKQRGQEEYNDIDGYYGQWFRFNLTEENRNYEYRFVLVQ